MTATNEITLRFARHNGARNAKTLLLHFEKTIGVLNAIGAKHAEAKADKRLSDVGRADVARDHAPALAPALVNAKAAAALTRRDIKTQRESLTPRVTDRKDVSSAMLRLDTRQFLRSKTVAEVARLAENDPSILEAIFEAPAAMSGLTDEVRGHILSGYLHKTAAPQMRDLAEQEAVAEVFETAIAMATNALADAAGVRVDQIDAWLTEKAPLQARAAADALETLPTKPANNPDEFFEKLLAEGRAEIAALIAS